MQEQARKRAQDHYRHQKQAKAQAARSVSSSGLLGCDVGLVDEEGLRAAWRATATRCALLLLRFSTEFNRNRPH